MNRIRILLLLFPVVLAAAGAIMLGLDPVFAIAWSIVVSAFVVLSGAVRTSPLPSWPPNLPEDRVAVSSVSRLAWAFDLHRNTASLPALLRVRGILIHRLRLRGLEWDDPSHRRAIERVVGDAGLVSRLKDGRATVAELRQALAIAEQIGPREDT